MIPHEDDPSLRTRHGDQQIERVRPRRLPICKLVRSGRLDEPMFDGGGISLDFAGTSPPVDRGINVPFCYTRAMACYAVKCLTVPGMPNNEGAVAPIQVSAPLTAFCVAPQSESPARGLFGGGDGSRRTILIDGRAVHPKGAHTVAPGQRFTMRDAGGGGFGEPANRPRAKILADVEEGLVTPAVAREVYGVEFASGYRA